MTALIIRAIDAISNPLPNTPALPDISSGLYWDLDAADLMGLGDGDAVSSWVGKGPSPANNRTLNIQPPGWMPPTFSPSGGAGGSPAVAFDGEQQIRISTDQAEPFNGPYTVALVCSGGSSAIEGVTSRARFYGGTGGVPTAIYPSTSGSLFVGYSYGGSSYTTLPVGHFVVVVSYNGGDSAWGMSGLAASPFVLPEPSWDGMGFGGNTLTGTPNGGLDGTITRARMYRRALSTYDIDALVSALEAEYGI